MSNLKLDIIYYKTSTDFEMEFNLSGCCRMRIFKERVDSSKNLVSALARDVARSKIIIVVTDLFGENCAIPVLSKAISLPLVAPDKKEFGIRTAEDIRIPATAVPLVTKTGIYGGCIIESGPQSIIIVSGVRSLRHEIMKAYVHNYVFDVGQLLAYQERIGQGGHNAMPPIVNAPVQSPATVQNTEEAVPAETAADLPEDTAEETQAVTDETAVSSSALVAEEADAAIEVPENIPEEVNAEAESIPADDTAKPDDLLAEGSSESTDEEPKEELSALDAAIKDEVERKERAEKLKAGETKRAKRPIQPGISAVDDLEFDEREVEELYKKSKKKRKGANIALLVIVILLLLGFGVLAYFFVYLPLTGADSAVSGSNSIVEFLTTLFS